MILLNGKKVEVNYFPNGEILLGEELLKFVTEKNETQHLTLRFEDNADLISMRFVKYWLSEEGYEEVYLHIPYLPYSRMDRKVSHHLFSLNYIAKDINSLGFKKVFILEAHSQVSLDLIDNSISVSYTKELIEAAMLQMNFDKSLDAIAFPDAGAKNRYKNLLSNDIRLLQGEKERDFTSGEIVKYNLVGDTSSPIRNVLIVDDLCSRGRTFIDISKALSEISVDNTFLAITHLESNVYTGSLFESVNHVFTTDALEPFLESAKNYTVITVLELPKKLKMTEEF